MARDLIETMFARRSIRRYTAEPITQAQIRTLLEAAMSAPSSPDGLPWHFVVVTLRQTLDALATLHPDGLSMRESPLCICVCGEPAASPDLWQQACSAATENTLLAATVLGLGSMWLSIYPVEERIDAVRRILRIPSDIVPHNLIAIGHPAERKEARTRYDPTRVHSGFW